MNGIKPVAMADDTLEKVSGGTYNGAVFMYTVLAHRFGTTVRILQELNNLTDDPDQLHPGRTLMIPQR